VAQPLAPSISLRRTPLLVYLLQGPSALANSTRVWLVLVAFLGVVNLFITFVDAGLERDARAVLFSWPSLAAFAVLGLVGIVFTPRAGFPAAGLNRAIRPRVDALRSRRAETDSHAKPNADH